MSRHHVDIDAPADQVYALIADARRRPIWLPELQATDATPARPLEKGDRFVGYASLLGHRFVGASEVVDAQPANRLEEHVVIGARFRTAWDITPNADGHGCRVTHDIDVEFPQGRLGHIERWLLSRYLERLQRKGLRRLAERSAAGE